MALIFTVAHIDMAGDYAVPNVLRPRDLVFRPNLSDMLKLGNRHQLGMVRSPTMADRSSNDFAKNH